MEFTIVGKSLSGDVRTQLIDFCEVNGSELEASQGCDGLEMMTLIINNFPQITGALITLIAFLKGRGVTVQHDGITIDEAHVQRLSEESK